MITPASIIELPSDPSDRRSIRTAVQTEREQLGHYQGAEAYQDIRARRAVLILMTMVTEDSEDTNITRLNFDRYVELMLRIIFLGKQFEDASDKTKTTWTEALRAQWEVVNEWIESGTRGNLPAIDE